MNTNKASTTTPFLDQLDAATKVDDVGVYIIEDFLSQEEAKESFEILNNSNNMPWKANPTLYRIKLNQHAYEFRRSKRNIKRASKSIGMPKLEELSRKIEKEFDGKVSYVWCNRLHPEHNVPYHTGKSISCVFVCCFMNRLLTKLCPPSLSQLLSATLQIRLVSTYWYSVSDLNEQLTSDTSRVKK